MKERNEKRPPRKKGIVPIAVLLTIGLVVNIACGIFYSAITPFMTANFNPLLTGQKQVTTGQSLTVEQAADQSRAMAQELVQEGAVLLKDQNNALPLAEGTAVNLFGYGSVDPIYGGSGSGASDTSSNIDLVTGLTNAGLTVNQELVDFYKKSGVSRAAQKGFEGSNFTPAEVPAAQYTNTLLQNAKAFSDVAIVTISRVGGEGGDLPQDMYAAGYSKTDDGRHYLELTQDEEDLLALIKAQGFGKVIVLINSSNAMELGFLEDDSIDAALWIGSLGSTGFNAVGEILSGKVNPSGRLSDTYAYDLTTAPAYWNAGDFTYANLKHHYVEYAEGIYVGYRFYETRYVDNTTGVCDEAAYAKAVQYPFGYGLSYTTFEQSIADYKTTDSAIEMTVEVKNTGAVAGKDVVQVYYTAPYTIGGIEKSHVVLAGFAKTGLLQPGASEKVTVTFAPEDMASYDETGAKAYVLEAGTYQIKLMRNAHEVIDQREYEVPATITYSGDNARSTDLVAATNEFEDVAQGQIKQYVSRADWEGTLPTTRTDGKTASAETVAAKENTPVYENNDSDQPITIADHGLTLEDMTGLDYDDPKWNDLLEQLSVDDMTNMISNGGWSTPEVASVGKPATNDLDGPAGINSLVSSLKGVSFPSEVIVGSSWNTDLAQRFGTAFGAEAAANHVVGLYAPGMNIHRTPFSGRNFEYYSEDGLLSGKMGAAMVQGVGSQGVYTYIKHFALNDQESNRLSISVWANEQSIREIYLKPFELSVKEGGTTAVMSSYSRLGNTWAGASKALLTDVLRNEWGFHGMVVTDSAMGNTSWMDINLALRAGGDMMLCLMGVKLDSSSNTAQQAMRRACHNILYTQANSIAIAAAVDNTPYWLILLAIVDSILLIAIVLLILKRIPAGKKLGKGAKAGICVGIAAVVALVFWAMFFRSSSAPTAAASSESAAASETAESTAAPEEEAKDGLFMELSQTDAGGWLGCHVYLMEDGSYSVTYDYNAENAGVEGEKGTYEIGADGTLTLTAEDGTVHTAAAAANPDGTISYTLEFTEANTSVVCKPTGTFDPNAASAAPAMEGLFMELSQKDAGGWLGCHVYLMQDGSYTVTYDYTADNTGIEGEKGTYEIGADGTLTLTAADGTVHTAAAAANADGTISYTLEFTEANTSVVCNPTGTLDPSAASAAPAMEGLLVELSQKDAGGWLGCHIYLMEDGSFSVAYDYTADNAGIEAAKGTYVDNGDGTLTLTADSGEEITVTVTDNGDGTKTYAAEVTEANTSIVCNPTGKR